MQHFKIPRLLVFLLAVRGCADGQKPTFGQACSAAGTCTPGSGLLEEEAFFLQTGVHYSAIGREKEIVGVDRAKASPHTSTTNRFIDEAARVSKIKTNAAGDLPAFLRSIGLDTGLFFGMVAAFMLLQRWYPQVYAYRVTADPGADGPKNIIDQYPTVKITSDGPPQILERLPNKQTTWFGWIRASFGIDDEEFIKTSGLDPFLLMRFTHLAMELMLVLGIPLIIVMIPIYAFAGGGKAGDDRLSWAGIGNVVYRAPKSVGSSKLSTEQEEMIPNLQWIWWLAAVITWGVVALVQYRIFTYQREFLERRRKWLLDMPAPQSTTVMVEGIPDQHCGDAEFKALFERLFSTDASQRIGIEDAFVVKKIWTLDNLIQTFQQLTMQRDEVEFEIKKEELKNPGYQPKFRCGGGEKLAYYNQELEKTRNAIIAEQEKIKNEVAKPASKSSIYSYNGFVTFYDRKQADLCLNLILDADENTLVVSRPPEPTDVLYYGLSLPYAEESGFNVVGYAALVGLFFAFLPIVLAIAQLASIDNVMKIDIAKKIILATGMKSTLSGVLASLGLTIMMSMLPTFLMWIFTIFFSAKASRWDQLRLQRYYFWFLVVFVMLITAIGGDLPKTLEAIAQKPFSIFSLLAHKLPLATHFYLNYCVMQPVTHGMNLTRYINMIKYLIYRRVCPEDVALQRCEPEDQDYYGMGSRSARFTLMLLIGIVFGTICPLMHVVVFWNFFVCRLVYGYLIPVAEQKKVDLGGLHWDLQMHHLSLGVLIYIALMAGVLLNRSDSKVPGIIAALSFVYWLFSYLKFKGKLRTTGLGYVDLADAVAEGAVGGRKGGGAAYGQKEIDAKPEDLLRIKWAS